MARQGIVLRVEKQKMTVMTEDGEFLALPTPLSPPRPGETIPITTRQMATKNYPKLALVAILLIAVLSISFFSPIFSNHSVAAVKFDLPVTLELGIDKQNRVVEIKAGDPIAQSLVEELDLQGKDIYTATNQVVQATCQRMVFSSVPLQEEAYVVTVMPRKGQQNVHLDRKHLHGQMEKELQRQQFEGYLVVLENEEVLKEKGATLTKALNSKDEEVLERNFPGQWSRVGHHHRGMNRQSPMNHGKQRGSPPAKEEPEQGSQQKERVIPCERTKP